MTMTAFNNGLAEFAEDGFDLPEEWPLWSYLDREAWAFTAEDEHGEPLPRRAQRWRLAIFRDYEATVDPSDVPEGVTFRPDSSASTSATWADVPLDGILDEIEAGTLTLPVPTVGTVDGGAGLFYLGRVNGLAGESGGGKGWVALAVALEHMLSGRHVYYLDLEDTPALALQRLVTVLGAPVAAVRALFHYVHPAGHDRAGIAALVERVRSTPEAFVVVDSTGESIAAAGLNQNADEDVARWFQDLAHPLAEAGACVLLIDHMTKSDDGGLWPIGSQRKRAAITGAQYVLSVLEPFSRSANGAVMVTVAKDRGGHREARSMASLVRFTHPVESTTTTPEGVIEVTLSDRLTVTLGTGKSAQQIADEKAAKAAAALDADVATVAALDPAPKSVRDVKDRLGWGSTRATEAVKEWRSRRS